MRRTASKVHPRTSPVTPLRKQHHTSDASFQLQPRSRSPVHESHECHQERSPLTFFRSKSTRRVSRIPTVTSRARQSKSLVITSKLTPTVMPGRSSPRTHYTKTRTTPRPYICHLRLAPYYEC